MHADPQLRKHLAEAGQARSMGVLLAVVACLAGVLALYWNTTVSMVSIWVRSETFTHGFIVIPVCLYFVWLRRQELSTIEPRPFFPALIGLAAAGALWLIGRLMISDVASQLGMVAMVPFAVWTVLGTRVARVLAFSLAFLFFAVPFGEFLVPVMMDRTADFTVWALSMSGVPVYRDGNFFMIPSGAWSVVEACSGLRYLIASLMIGCFYAYISYRSPRRRIAFIAASIVVPIIANWLRAYFIVMLAHLTNNKLATGVDHIIYGWIFFGVVMAFLFWLGSRWRDTPRDEPSDSIAKNQEPALPRPPRFSPAAIAATVLLAALWQPLYAHLADVAAPTPVSLRPAAAAGGWVEAPRFTDWQPDLVAPAAELQQTFAKGGSPVGLYIAFYRHQTQETKAITTRNTLVRTRNKDWRPVASETISVNMDGGNFTTRAAVISGRNQRLAAWQWYWVDGHVTTSDYIAKLLEAFALLRGHGDSVAWVVVYTATDTDEIHVRELLRKFTADMHGSIESTLAEAARE